MVYYYSALKESRDYGQTDDDEDGVDLRECECANILTKVYPQMVYHWKAAGNVQKTIRYLMEAAAACIATFNHMQV